MRYNWYIMEALRQGSNNNGIPRENCMVLIELAAVLLEKKGGNSVTPASFSFYTEAEILRINKMVRIGEWEFTLLDPETETTLVLNMKGSQSNNSLVGIVFSNEFGAIFLDESNVIEVLDPLLGGEISLLAKALESLNLTTCRLSELCLGAVRLYFGANAYFVTKNGTQVVISRSTEDAWGDYRVILRSCSENCEVRFNLSKLKVVLAVEPEARRSFG